MTEDLQPLAALLVALLLSVLAIVACLALGAALALVWFGFQLTADALGVALVVAVALGVAG
jgi:hypothetical protein